MKLVLNIHNRLFSFNQTKHCNSNYYNADYADLFFEHKISNNISLQDKKVNRAFSNIDFGVGIRVLKGDQTGFAYSENIGLDDMLNAAKMAASIANEKASYNLAPVTEKVPSSYYKISRQWEDVSVKDKIPFVQKFNDKVFELDEKVIKVNAHLDDETSYVLFFRGVLKTTLPIQPLLRTG